MKSVKKNNQGKGNPKKIEGNKIKKSALNKHKQNMKYKTFIGNKDEGQGYADKRKKHFMRHYKKTLAKEDKANPGWKETTAKIYQEVGETVQKSDRRRKSKKLSSFHKAEQAAEKTAQETVKKKEEIMIRKRETDAAIDKYQTKRKNSHKKLAKRNYKGQPNLASQMDLLLQKIQSDTGHK